MFSAVCAIALLCLVSVSQSAPPACEELVRPLDQLDPHHLEGRWVLVAGSVKDSAAADAQKGRDSVTIDFSNSTYTQVNRLGDQCDYYPFSFSMDGHILTLKVGSFNFTGTLFHTSCPDCAVLRLDMVSSNYKSVDLYLFSRRRAVEQKEMENFKAQVECLNMPPPIVMDPTKELCPEKPETEEKEA